MGIFFFFFFLAKWHFISFYSFYIYICASICSICIRLLQRGMRVVLVNSELSIKCKQTRKSLKIHTFCLWIVQVCVYCGMLHFQGDNEKEEDTAVIAFNKLLSFGTCTI